MAQLESTRPVLLVDGPSGSGKTTLATFLAKQLPLALPQWADLQLVSLDSFYPGWQGLAAASTMLAEDVLATQNPGFTSWDWEANRPGTWVSISPTRPLLVEGCGALTRQSRPLADYALWVELPETIRKERALTRDGDTFAPHWQEWLAQEQAHWQQNRPWELADLSLPLNDVSSGCPAR
ncbi:hypothetical protein BK816_06735 [Boudabousia tangfeifanii]|uniref:Uncharacterized protein n=1 Tax=Boudabousia tangfeifanii TaxID=1912795 RepID=A0A1D9MMJ1_9ACTO|nr:hypothetical protein BK816_06735 [Boudabousia tangfeifanii]